MGGTGVRIVQSTVAALVVAPDGATTDFGSCPQPAAKGKPTR